MAKKKTGKAQRKVSPRDSERKASTKDSERKALSKDSERKALSKDTERKAFKDYFDRAAARELGAQIGQVSSDFDQKKFVQRAATGLDTLEFAGRVSQFSDAMREHLPDAIPAALDILTNSLPDELPDCESVTDGWLQWPIGQFIHDHGLEHFEPSMRAMIELTKRFSSEYAVRRFVQTRPEETFERLLSLTGDASPHVRRWCSEGIRPRLPWGVKLTELVEDPSPIWPILDVLKDDNERYVRRSVANNINDIAKDNPDDVLRHCARWSKKSNDLRDYTIQHGLRSLIKAGDAKALALVGYGPPRKLSVDFQVSPTRVNIGESVEFELTCTSAATGSQELMIDYVVHYVRKGTRATNAGKVFKWTTKTLAARDALTLKKRHAMKATTIRALYPGTHRVEVQINGQRVAETKFHLSA